VNVTNGLQNDFKEAQFGVQEKEGSGSVLRQYKLCLGKCRNKNARKMSQYTQSNRKVSVQYGHKDQLEKLPACIHPKRTSA
jgi:hypothetical protein